jgi:hypothetical protein
MKSVFLAGGVLGVAASVLILWVEKSGGNVFSLLLVSPGAVALFARSDALSPGPLYVSWVQRGLVLPAYGYRTGHAKGFHMVLALRSNLSVNTDAHGRPLPSVALIRGRRLRPR